MKKSEHLIRTETPVPLRADLLTMSGANAPPAQNVDEGGEIVLNRFFDFLAKFTSSAEGTTDGTDGVQLYRDYLAQIAAMVQNDKNTVYVDVQHVFAVRIRLASGLLVA